MKNKLFLLSLAVVCMSSAVKAQNEEGQSVVTLGAGYSLVNNIVKSGLETYSDVNVKSVPTIALTYDYGLTDNFSLGVAAAYQSVSGEFTNTYFDNNLDLQTETAKSSFSRMNIAIRPLFHYGGSDKLDLYSGLRVGMLFRNSEVESEQENIDLFGDLSGSRVSIGIVAFGMRYFVSDNIGINMDLQVGTPYIMSAGVAARF